MLIKLTPCDMPEKDIVTAYTMAATVQDTIRAGCLNNKPILGYLEGLETPNYPVPMCVPNRFDVKTYGDNYAACWTPINEARQLFRSIKSVGGINWDWCYFLLETDAIAFEHWCTTWGHETRGISAPWDRGAGWGVWYR